jgi:hypothetical protein
MFLIWDFVWLLHVPYLQHVRILIVEIWSITYTIRWLLKEEGKKRQESANCGGHGRNSSRQHFIVKMRVAAFYSQKLRRQIHRRRTRVTTATVLLHTSVTWPYICSKFTFPLTLILPSSWDDVTAHKGITTSFNDRHVSITITTIKEYRIDFLSYSVLYGKTSLVTTT